MLDATRGRGLGGTSNVNMCIWTTPCKANIDEWQARVGGDLLYSWDNTRRLLDGLVDYRRSEAAYEADGRMLPRENSSKQDLSEFMDVPHSGRINDRSRVVVEYSHDVTTGDVTILQGFESRGIPVNRAPLGEYPMGIALYPSSAESGCYRVTGATAFLASPPSNLVIMTDSEVSQVLFEGSTAVGVVVRGGEHAYTAKKSIVVSAGAVGTPKLLMLSGIGPASELARHGIPIVMELPGVGANLRDHCDVSLDWETRPSFGGVPKTASTTPAPNQDLLSLAIAFLRPDSILSIPQLAALPAEERRQMGRDGTPLGELATQANWPKDIPHAAPNWVVRSFALPMQSRGSVKLAGPDWRAAPVIDPNYMNDNHGGFDMAALVAVTRLVLDMAENTPLVQQHLVKNTRGPKSRDDEIIAAWIRETLAPGWHYVGTARMGSGPEDAGSVVDTSFRVHGLDRLRVVDCSIAPILPDCHTQSVAYLTGAWAAERMVEEYGL